MTSKIKLIINDASTTLPSILIITKMSLAEGVFKLRKWKTNDRELQEANQFACLG